MLGRYNLPYLFLFKTYKQKLLSRLSDLKISREQFNIQHEGFISQLWSTVGR